MFVRLMLSEKYNKLKGFKKFNCDEREREREREREMWCEVVSVKYSIYKEMLNA